MMVPRQGLQSENDDYIFSFSLLPFMSHTLACIFSMYTFHLSSRFPPPRLVSQGPETSSEAFIFALIERFAGASQVGIKIFSDQLEYRQPNSFCFSFSLPFSPLIVVFISVVERGPVSPRLDFHTLPRR